MAHAAESNNIEADFIHEVEAWISKEEAEGRRSSGCRFGFARKVSESSLVAASFARELEAWIFKEEAEGRRSSGCQFGFADKFEHYADAECKSWGCDASFISASFADVASTATATRCQVAIPLPAASTAASTTVGDCSVSSKDCAGSRAMDGPRCKSPDSNCCAHPEPLRFAIVSQDIPAATASAAAAGLRSPAEPNEGLVSEVASNHRVAMKHLRAWRRTKRLWVKIVWCRQHPDFVVGALLIGGTGCNLMDAVGKAGAKLQIRGHQFQSGKAGPVSMMITATGAFCDPEDFQKAVEITLDRLEYVAERYKWFCMKMKLPPPTAKQPCFSFEAYSRNAEVLLKDLLALGRHPRCAKIIERVTAATVASGSMLVGSVPISSDATVWTLRKLVRKQAADSWAALRMPDAAHQDHLATAVYDQALINMFYCQCHSGVIPPYIWIDTPCVPGEGHGPHMICFSSLVALDNGCSCPAFSNCCSSGHNVPYTSCGNPMFHMGYCGGEAGHNVNYNMLGTCFANCPAPYSDVLYSFHCISPVQDSEDGHEFWDKLYTSVSAGSSGCGESSSASKWLNAISAAPATLQNVNDTSNLSNLSARDDTPNLEDVLESEVCNYIYGDSHALHSEINC